MFKTIQSRQAAMPFIMFTALLDMVAVGLIIPVLPSLIGSFTDSRSEQVMWYTIMACSFALSNFLASPVLGALSDSYGRRPVLLLGFLGFSVSFFGNALAPSLGVLIGVRLAAGALQSNMAIANAYVADITPPEQRARRFGMLGAMFGLGFIIGPVLGGLLGNINLRLPFWVAGSLAMVNWLYGYFVLPESLPKDRRHPVRRGALNPFRSLLALAQLGGVGQLVGVVALSALAQFVLYSSWVLYTTYKFGWGPLQNGWSLAAVGIVSAIVQGLLLGRILRRFAAPHLAILALSSSTMAYLCWGAATEGWMMYAVIGVNLLGVTAGPAVQSMISSAAQANNQGQTLGAVSALNSLMAVIAPALTGPLLGPVAHLPHGDWRLGAPFYFCALLQACSLTLAVMYFRRHGRSHASHSSDTSVLK